MESQSQYPNEHYLETRCFLISWLLLRVLGRLVGFAEAALAGIVVAQLLDKMVVGLFCFLAELEEVRCQPVQPQMVSLE